MANNPPNNNSVSNNPQNSNEETPQVKRGFIKQLMAGLSTPKPDDLPSKEITQKVIAIAWPAMLESFLLHLVSMVNTMMVGGLGTWAIASIGYCQQPRMLLLAVFQAFNTGSTAMVARAKGAGNIEDANKIMHQSIMFSLSLSFIFAIVGYFFSESLVRFMGASEDITIAAGTQYMRMTMLSFPANALTLAITAVLRGIGKTRASMVYNVTANVINIIVGYFLISGNMGAPRLEVLGAATGMVSGQLVATAIALFTIIRGSDMLKLRLKYIFKFDRVLFGGVIRIGTPAMLEQLFMRFGQTMFTKVVAGLGTDAYATHQIANNILSMTMMNGQAFGVSATSLAGQSLGKKRADHAKAYVQICRRYAMFISLGLAAGLVFFGGFFTGMYTTEAAVIAQGAMLLKMVAIIQPLQSSQQVLSGALRGAGDTKAVALCTFLGIVVVRPIFSYIMVYWFNWGLVGVWLSLISDQSIRSCYTMWRFASDRWKNYDVTKSRKRGFGSGVSSSS